MPSYILRNLDPEIWKRAKVKAAQDGISLRAVVHYLLTQYGNGVIVVTAPPKETTP